MKTTGVFKWTKKLQKMTCHLDSKQAWLIKAPPRKFAKKTSTQGIGSSFCSFSSLMRDYLDPLMKTDQCAQYVDDISIAANTTEQFADNIRAVSACISEAELKLTMASLRQVRTH